VLVKKKEMRSVVGNTVIPKVTPPETVFFGAKKKTSRKSTGGKYPRKAVPTEIKVRPLVFRPLQKKFVRRKHITTITIEYCSTVGLIVAGVLPKPYPDWKPPGHYAAALSENDIAVSRVNLDKITETITYKDDNGLEHQAFQLDLTELSDDEEKDGK
jgi:hypothetical protein